MKKMWPEKIESDDLDYLARRGYEECSPGTADLRDLNRKIRSRSGRYRNLYVVRGTALFLTALFGVFLYTRIYTSPVPVEAPVQHGLEEQPLPASAPAVLSREEADTLVLEGENFVSPLVSREAPADRAGSRVKTVTADSIQAAHLPPLEMLLLNIQDLHERKLKYMINSPVFYLHDMKITDYTTLYFRHHRFVRLPGLPAVHADRPEAVKGNGSLKQEAEYYLHEEIARAMNYFRKGSYTQAIPVLKQVATYNEKDINCDFYLGMCYYYQGNYKIALPFFENCIQHPNNAFLQESTFYKAQALYETGEREQARALLTAIISEEGFYSEQARRVLAGQK